MCHALLTPGGGPLAGNPAGRQPRSIGAPTRPRSLRQKCVGSAWYVDLHPIPSAFCGSSLAPAQQPWTSVMYIHVTLIRPFAPHPISLLWLFPCPRTAALDFSHVHACDIDVVKPIPSAFCGSFVPTHQPVTSRILPPCHFPCISHSQLHPPTLRAGAVTDLLVAAARACGHYDIPPGPKACGGRFGDLSPDVPPRAEGDGGGRID